MLTLLQLLWTDGAIKSPSKFILETVENWPLQNRIHPYEIMFINSSLLLPHLRDTIFGITYNSLLKYPQWDSLNVIGPIS